MITSACFCIGTYSFATAIDLSCYLLVILNTISKLIRVYKITARIIGWIAEEVEKVVAGHQKLERKSLPT